MEHGEVGRSVLEKAELVDQRKLTAEPCRHASFLADVGRGMARDPKSRHEAITWPRNAESVAPQRIRNGGPVRETVAVMLEQVRAAG